jgi:hypothetical protein
MRFINKRQKIFIFEVKDNRKVTDSGIKRNLGQVERLSSILHKTTGCDRVPGAV